jgi:hypothetical protein
MTTYAGYWHAAAADCAQLVTSLHEVHGNIWPPTS